MTQPTETDPRVSTPDDGFELMDDADSVAEQAALPADSFHVGLADFETEH